ncbi:MAG TPA: nucleotide disphospho-sugar-binding domain-containing protein [Ideonella sp.]|uniref:glycosyltransferase n=1 Tax=Ideonella sp. TaxID=1929293 RepID=UPI002E355104|nr:nucleotide disphospho-sugar-binding domain-containing protein [Ideonella sp.]HEX5683914.1 nucleotide disphospho-sugar-binding domain-containing protein [Ideonella sp.]
MRFAVVTLGSAGDLHPFLAVARALVQRGHEVQLLSQAPYEGQSLAEGVPFRAVVDTAAHERTLKHPLLWHPLHGFGVLWRHLAVPSIGPTCDVLDALTHATGDRWTVLASPLAAGARFARERWPDRIRLLSGYTAPMGLRSADDPMFLGAWQVPRWVPPPARRVLWHLLDQWKLEPMARPALQRWQAQWGTPRIATSVFGDWLHSPDGGIALYPPEFASIPSNWRRRGVMQTGFPLYEPSVQPALPTAWNDFVRRHPRYVLAYPGSAAGAAERFNDLVLPACRRLGQPVVILSPHLRSDDIPLAAMAPDVLSVRHAPLSALLRGASAFVHHGGIGSVAQALRFDVPQLVLASAYDQFENGCRLTGQGHGTWLPLNRATAETVRERLSTLLSPDAAAGEAQQRPSIDDDSQAATRRTCELLEETSRRPLSS